MNACPPLPIAVALDGLVDRANHHPAALKMARSASTWSLDARVVGTPGAERRLTEVFRVGSVAYRVPPRAWTVRS